MQSVVVGHDTADRSPALVWNVHVPELSSHRAITACVGVARLVVPTATHSVVGDMTRRIALGVGWSVCTSRRCRSHCSATAPPVCPTVVQKRVAGHDTL